jgi:hypothetical protein
VIDSHHELQLCLPVEVPRESRLREPDAAYTIYWPAERRIEFRRVQSTRKRPEKVVAANVSRVAGRSVIHKQETTKLRIMETMRPRGIGISKSSTAKEPVEG